MEHVAAWETFYVIVGSAAAALTGLTFVVITLITRRRVHDLGPLATFTTPTVVHFGAALLVAAILSAPWQGLSQVGAALGLCGLAGLGYGVIVMRRLRRQSAYAPVLEDWLFHAIFPIASYAAILAAAIALPGDLTPALFVAGAATLLLLFIGIHNAWDTATWTAIVVPQREDIDRD